MHIPKVLSKAAKWAVPLLVTAGMMATAAPAFAGDNGGNGGVEVVIAGNQWFYNATEDPFVRLHEAWILPCGENPESEEPVWYYYYEWGEDGHPDEIWVDMGFPIAIVVYTWHYGPAGEGDFQGWVYGSCFEPSEVVPMMYLSTSEAGFYTSSIDGLPVNTCSLISVAGFPSAERVGQLCGSVPEDIERNVCYGPVSQMTPTDVRGFWPCDLELMEWGETRLPLFGPDFGTGPGTLYDVLMTHYSHLEALGIPIP